MRLDVRLLYKGIGILMILMANATQTTFSSGSAAYLFIDHDWSKPVALLFLPIVGHFDDKFLIYDETSSIIEYLKL